MKRILQVSASLNRGGAETMLMNLFYQINREQYQFDFLVYDDCKSSYVDEVIGLGGNVINLRRHRLFVFTTYLLQLYKINKKYGPYDAIHVHTNFHSAIPLLAAKILRIKTRVCHSHTTKDRDSIGIVRALYQRLMRVVIHYSANTFLACGTEAGYALYGRDFYINRGQFFPNAIDISKFALSSDNIKHQYRNQLKINNDEIVIGSIASFREAKNHDFMLRIAKFMLDRDIKFKMIFVGSGDLFESVKSKCASQGLDKNVIFLGLRNDIPELMHFFDVLLMPSLYEGFPVTLVESQAAFLYAVVSDRITTEVDMGTGLVKSLSLNEDIESWINCLTNRPTINNKAKNDTIINLKEKGFDVVDSAVTLCGIYEN